MIGVASSSSAPALSDASQWIEALLSSSLALSVGVLAMAGLGFGMLSGRMPIRRAGTLIVGSFVFFGASSIARALLKPDDRSVTIAVPTPDVIWNAPPAVVARPVQAIPQVSDPYAGASVPTP